MNQKRLGRQTVALERPPALIGWAAVAGQKERKGPLGALFSATSEDDTFGESSWEKAESAMQRLALSTALDRAGLAGSALDYVLAGDLLNQCISSTFALRGREVPFFGLYGACSTMAESLSLASLLLDGGFGRYAAALTSSHFCSAERQYRTPLEYGGQRTPTAQWTVTGAGAAVLSREGNGPYVTHATIGKVVDKGIKDANNMGAAMAPAAYSTLTAHFADTGRRPADYDLIVTGDLGELGRSIVLDLFSQYSWPGNIRQLENIVEYCVNMAEGAVVQPEDLPAYFIRELSEQQAPTLKGVESAAIREMLNHYGWDVKGKTRTAEALGISLRTLYRKMDQAHLSDK